MTANIITIAILIAYGYVAIRHIISDKKKGIGSCGMPCGECASHCDHAVNTPERFKLKK